MLTPRRPRRWELLPALAGLQLIVAAPALAQHLRLADAIQEAHGKAFANRRARAASDEGHASAMRTLKGLLPSARIEGGFVRTTDPIGAFGTSLRQRIVSPAAFEPSHLNNPAPINNVVSSLVVEVPVFNGDAITALRAARSAAGATDAIAEWTAHETDVQVIRAWFGTVLAAEKARMLEQAHGAALASVRQIDAMVRQGLVTKADALQASVRAGDVATEWLQARNDVTTAGQQVAMLLGRRRGESVAVESALPADSLLRQLAAHDSSTSVPTLDVREDLRATRLGVEAANADRQRAMTTMMPRVNGFARYDYNAPASLYTGKPNWTIGVMGSWSLFGGASEIADVAATRARQRSAEASAEEAQTNARLEVDMTSRAIRVALQRLDLVALNEAQSREAFRLVDRRYQGGLATIAERLGAESAATNASLAHAAARYALIDALVLHRRAIGADLGALTQLDQTPDSDGVHR